MSSSVTKTIKDFNKVGGKDGNKDEYSSMLAEDIETAYKIDEFYDLDLDKIVLTVSQVNFQGIQNQYEIIKTIIEKTIEKHKEEEDITKLLTSINPDPLILTQEQAIDIISYFKNIKLCAMINPKYFKGKDKLEERSDFIMFQMLQTNHLINLVNQNNSNDISSLYIPKKEESNIFTVKTLKDHIKRLLQLRGDSAIDLYINNRIISDSQNVKDLNLENNSIIYYNIIRNDSCIQINIMNANEEIRTETVKTIHPIEIKTTDKIKDLKSIIEREFSIVPSRQKLKFYRDGSGTVVNDNYDDKCLKEIGIDKNNIVVVVEEGPEPVQTTETSKKT